MEAIDLFAGAGGFTEGARQAGVKVVWAANHWPLAVEFHSTNHPDTIHACQDLRQTNWSTVPHHDLLLASPSCTGHTPARGKEKPHHDEARSTAWAVVDCAEYHRPEYGVVENVPAFLRWSLYSVWADAMRRLGYAVSPHIVDAADHGVPQNRVRVFIVLSRSKSPIVLKLPHREHRPFRSIVEWDKHAWSPIAAVGRRPRAEATLRRIAAGRADFGDCFVMPYYSDGSGLTGRSIDRPIGTFSTKARWAIVRADEMRMVQPREVAAGMTFPKTYTLPHNKAVANMMLGNAVAPKVARDILCALQKVA